MEEFKTITNTFLQLDRVRFSIKTMYLVDVWNRDEKWNEEMTFLRNKREQLKRKIV